MTHRGPFQPLLFCDSVILSHALNCVLEIRSFCVFMVEQDHAKKQLRTILVYCTGSKQPHLGFMLQGYPSSSSSGSKAKRGIWPEVAPVY